MYYLYRHTRLDTLKPFYIGIGTIYPKRKTFNSIYQRAFLRSRRSTFWKNIIAKTSYDVEILLESNNYEYIKSKEKEFIKLYGRKDNNTGCLVNHTDGGEGNLGYVFSDETKIKLKKARNISPGGRNNKPINQIDILLRDHAREFNFFIYKELLVKQDVDHLESTRLGRFVKEDLKKNFDEINLVSEEEKPK